MLRSTLQYLKCFRKIGKMKNDFGTNSNNNNNNNGANGNKKKTSAKEIYRNYYKSAASETQNSCFPIGYPPIRRVSPKGV